mmetsp:Transcript_18575/g.47026  ORF Transcript_18575/g.47026 Transcript_18575/m.47026 type:complete len:218 (+) Transcript_18575:72-725(+)
MAMLECRHPLSSGVSKTQIRRQRVTAHALPFGIKLPTWGQAEARTSTTKRLEELQLQLNQSSQGTRYGAAASAQDQEHVLQVVDELKGLNPKASAPVSKLDGTWQLLYTTEKSVHGLVKVLPVQNITQTIDINDQRVTNRIQLAANSALQASAPMRAVNNSRIEYAFDTLTLTLFGLNLDLSSIVRGGGWTEAVFCSQDMRVMENSQGDTLVFEKQA